MTACGGASTDTADAAITEVRDSAGIRIVEDRLPDGVAPVYAELGDVQLQIGVVEGEAAYQFTRVAAIRTMGDGGLLVAETSGLELRIFDAAGSHVTTLGRQGNGPGEFASFTDVGVMGDTVWVFDARQRRATLFRSDGTLLEAQRVGADQVPGGPEEHMWLFPDGSWLNLREILDIDVGLRLARAALIRLPPELLPMDTVTVIPWEESYVSGEVGDGFARIYSFRLPYPRSGSVAVAPHLFVAGWNATYRLEYWSPDGTLHTVATAPDLEVALASDEVEREGRSRLEGCMSAQCKDAAAVVFSEEMLPTLRPAFSDLLIDTPGNVWVAPYQPPEDEPVTWHVFSPQGELMGRVSIPEGLTVHEIGEDYVLGVVMDDFDVPYVRRYGLTRLR